MKNKTKKMVLISSIIVVFIILITSIYIFSEIGPYDTKNNKEITVEIPKGSTLNKTSDILYKSKVIKNKMLFKILGKITEEGSKIKAGTYVIDQKLSNKEVLDLLSSGKGQDIGIKVTIPEGYTTKEIVTLLVSKNLGNKEVYEKLIKDPSEFSNEFNFLKNLKSLEGYLYPETYYFENDLSEKEILTKMIKRFDKIYTEKFEERQKELGVDLDYIITLASIVEKEAVLDKDRPIIASVFYNRLKIDMALQSDATLQYAFPERKGRVMYKDLEIDSPYNSYKNKGLPPTPIACPGVKSIESTLYPDNTNYLYFVANVDKSNDYSSTYEEHLKHDAENKKERESMRNNQ